MQAVKHGSGALSGADVLILICDEEAKKLKTSQLPGRFYREDYSVPNPNRTHSQGKPGYPYVMDGEMSLAIGKNFSGAKAVDACNYLICPTTYGMLIEGGRISLRYDTNYGNTLTILNYDRKKNAYRSVIECLGF